MAGSLRQFSRQAQQQALARYGPQRSALASLLAQAADDMANQIASSSSAARGVGAAARAAVPQVQSYYQTDRNQQSNLYGGLASQLAALGPGADAIKAASANEATMAQAELGREQAGTESELTQRQVDAQAQRAQDIQAAHVQFSQRSQKLADQLTALSGQEGAFTASTIQSLSQAAAQRAVTRRGQDITKTNAAKQRALTRRGQDLAHPVGANGKPVSTKKPTSGPGSLTRIQENAARDQIQQAQSVIRTYTKQLTPAQIRAGLAQGGLTDSAGKKLPLPKVPVDLINAAFDLQKKGRLTTSTVRALHARGLHIPAAWRPDPVASALQTYAGSVGL